MTWRNRQAQGRGPEVSGRSLKQAENFLGQTPPACVTTMQIEALLRRLPFLAYTPRSWRKSGSRVEL
jgi:hypothetical protein